MQLYALLAQLTSPEIGGLVKEGGVVATLVWFVWYFQRKWDTLDRRHEELHEKTLSAMSTYAAAISAIAVEVKGMRREVRLCQIVRSGDLEAVKKALEETDTE